VRGSTIDKTRVGVDGIVEDLVNSIGCRRAAMSWRRLQGKRGLNNLLDEHSSIRCRGRVV